MTPEFRYEPETVLPPGATLQEVLADKGMTQADLARRTGLSTKHINQIIKGDATVTAETTILLERATGVPAHLWANLESAYQVHQSRVNEHARLGADLDLLSVLPARELKKRGWISSDSPSVDTLREIFQFFGVADKSSWEMLWQRPTAYRRSKVFSCDPGAVAAWLRIGELRAAELECRSFEKQVLTARLNDIRSLTRERDPAVWYPRIREIGQEAGVAIVIEPEIPGARVVGAARWLTSNRALIQLSLRHKWSDIFWFTLLHEIGHLLLHSKKDVFINDPGPHSGAEAEADAFAARTLIPPEHESRLGDLETEEDVENFAAELGIGPNIVVGRLQFDERWPYNKGTALKHRFTFTS